MKDHPHDRQPLNKTYNLGLEGRRDLSRFQLVPVHIAEEGLRLDWSMMTPGHAQSVTGIPLKQLQQRYSPAAQWLWSLMVTLLTVDILMVTLLTVVSDGHLAYCGHPDGHLAYCGHPDGHLAYCGHPDGHPAYCGHPDGHPAYCGHPDGHLAYCGL